ncbi:hypothetical protein ACIOEX_20545 [Streptomyces sp. NPDC087850]
MAESDEPAPAPESTVRRIVAEAATDLDDEWTLLQMLGVET